MGHITTSDRPYCLRLTDYGDPDDVQITVLGPYPAFEDADAALERLHARETRSHWYEITMMLDPAEEDQLHP